MEKKAYERAAAAADATRYRLEVAKWETENRRLKRPTSAYVDFVDNFLEKNIKDYPSFGDAVSAANRVWEHISEEQKMIWRTPASS